MFHTWSILFSFQLLKQYHGVKGTKLRTCSFTVNNLGEHFKVGRSIRETRHLPVQVSAQHPRLQSTFRSGLSCPLASCRGCNYFQTYVSASQRSTGTWARSHDVKRRPRSLRRHLSEWSMKQSSRVWLFIKEHKPLLRNAPWDEFSLKPAVKHREQKSKYRSSAYWGYTCNMSPTGFTSLYCVWQPIFLSISTFPRLWLRLVQCSG